MEEISPSSFFKYRSADEGSMKYLISQIEKDEVWFSKPSDFNDPFDCHPFFDLSGNNCEIAKKLEATYKKMTPTMSRSERRSKSRESAKNSRVKEIQQQFKSSYFEKIRNEIGIYCLSTTEKSTLMWSHYANYHRGICLEYEGIDEFFSNAFPVIYSESRPIVYGYKDSDDQLQLENALLTKSDAWAYEKEWRMIAYTKGPGLYKIPDHLLKRIIFGAQADKRTIEDITKIANGRKHPPIISHAKLAKDKFEIIIE